MNYAENFSTNRLAQELASLELTQFTGKLEVKSSTGKQWKLYLGLGRLVWAEGTEHPYRSWQRHLAQFCPQISWRDNDIREAEKYECWNYYLLTVLLQRKTLVKEQLKALVTNKISEVVFDIFQQEASEPQLQYIPKPETGDFLLASGLKMSLTLVNVKLILTRVQQTWSTWREKGLDRVSPNLAPSLKNLEQLQQEVSPQVYQNLVKLIDGQRTLRDIAVLINWDALQLTCSLVRYASRGWIELSEIYDMPPFKALINSVLEQETGLSTFPTVPKPLIACIDDSQQICRMMEHLIKKAGYEFIGIQNPLQALPTLIDSEPDLIFLDIAMPIVNGYEICTQLRRVSKLKQIPVIMLTGRDGIIDRVRAKVVGASGFIAKPIEISKIIDTVQRVLPFANDNKTNQTPISQFETKLTLTTV